MVKPISYKYQNSQLEIYPKFLYEVTLYKISLQSASILSCRYYTSDKFLKIKGSEMIKRCKDFYITRFITLLGAPESFIEKNNLSIYQLKRKNNEA